MRLIDADALVFTRVRIAHEDGTIGGYNAVVMSSEIKNAPTIDAVPISFIRSEIERMKEGNNRYYSECEAYAEDLDILLMEWERRKNEQKR